MQILPLESSACCIHELVPTKPEEPEMNNVSFDPVNWVQGWKPSNRMRVRIDCLFSKYSPSMLTSSSKKETFLGSATYVATDNCSYLCCPITSIFFKRSTCHHAIVFFFSTGVCCLFFFFKGAFSQILSTCRGYISAKLIYMVCIFTIRLKHTVLPVLFQYFPSDC